MVTLFGQTVFIYLLSQTQKELMQPWTITVNFRDFVNPFANNRIDKCIISKR